MSETNLSQPETKSFLARPPRRWVVVATFLLVFLSGCVVGAGVTFLSIHKRVLYALHHPEQAPGRITTVLRRRLDLTEEQARQVEGILSRRQSALAALRREVQPRVEAEIDLVEKEISTVLNETQRKQWQEKIRELRRTWIPPAPRPSGTEGTMK